jgi:hypothetical protein
LNILANAPAAFSISSPSNALSATVSAGQSASYALQLTPGLDYNGTISFTCTGAPLGAICQAPASVTLSVGAPAALTVRVVTSGGAITTPKITSRRLPHAPASPGALAVALGTLIFVLVLCLYRELGASIPALGSHDIAVENDLCHGGATDIRASDIGSGWLRGRIDNCAYSPENFYGNAERHLNSGRHADRDQRLRQGAADAADSVNAGS